MRIPSMFLVMLALAGCVASRTPAPSPGATLEDTDWRLTELRGQPAHTGPDGTAPTLRLVSAEKQASGNAGCNRFNASYLVDGPLLSFGPIGSTRRACVEDALNRQETAYLLALDATRTWRVSGDSLVLSGDSGPLARFVATP